MPATALIMRKCPVPLIRNLERPYISLWSHCPLSVCEEWEVREASITGQMDGGPQAVWPKWLERTPYIW